VKITNSRFQSVEHNLLRLVHFSAYLSAPYYLSRHRVKSSLSCLFLLNLNLLLILLTQVLTTLAPGTSRNAI